MNAPTQTTDKTGIEAIDCTNCYAPHIVDYDTHAVEIQRESQDFNTFLDDDGQSFDCIDCGTKVPA